MLITLLGSWWLYLIFGLSSRLAELEVQSEGPNIVRLIKWEGSAFIILLFIIIISHTILFMKDQKKNKAIHAFFAGLTHELKTPLASIRLQAEVIKDESDRIENKRLDKLTNRLIEDTARLETQMDKILQLSRMEKGGNLNLVSVNLHSFIQREIKDLAIGMDTTISGIDPETEVLIDEFAFAIIIKNFIQNTRNHTTSKTITIEGKQGPDTITISYKDNGVFDGNIKKLGNLFYKHNSSKGSGIGLYLSKRLIKRMNGQLRITKNTGLVFEIEIPLYQGERHD